MKIFSSSLLLAIISVMFLCCKKDPVNTTPTKTDLITSGAWIHESSGVDFDKNGSIDLTLVSLNVPDCRLDNVLTFKKDNAAITDEGAVKCNTSDPQTTSFNWNFADSETALNISGNVFTALNGKLTIRNLTSTNLSLSKDTVVSTQNVRLIVNLKH